MKPFLGAETTIRVGVETVVESNVPDGTWGVVFEDDGETGYFYARDHRQSGTLFVDVLHVYSVEGVADRDRAVKLKILWTRDFEAAALLLNLRPQAVFHFGRRCGYADDPFPEPDNESGWDHTTMSSEIRDLFFPS